MREAIYREKPLKQRRRAWTMRLIEASDPIRADLHPPRSAGAE